MHGGAFLRAAVAALLLMAQDGCALAPGPTDTPTAAATTALEAAVARGGGDVATTALLAGSWMAQGRAGDARDLLVRAGANETAEADLSF